MRFWVFGSESLVMLGVRSSRTGALSWRGPHHRRPRFPRSLTFPASSALQYLSPPLPGCLTPDWLGAGTRRGPPGELPILNHRREWLGASVRLQRSTSHRECSCGTTLLESRRRMLLVPGFCLKKGLGTVKEGFRRRKYGLSSSAGFFLVELKAV
jgi:hypothetical protein